MEKVTPEHVKRARRLIGCGLDEEAVSHWLATHDADKAEIKRLQNKCGQYVSVEYDDLQRDVKQQAEIKQLREKVREAREAARWYFKRSGTFTAECALKKGWAWLGAIGETGPEAAEAKE